MTRTTYLVVVGSGPHKRKFIVSAPDGVHAIQYTKQLAPKETDRSAEPFSVAVERGAITDIHELKTE